MSSKIVTSGFIVVAALLALCGMYLVIHGDQLAYHGAMAAAFALMPAGAIMKSSKSKTDWFFIGICAFNVVLHGFLSFVPRA